MIDAPSKEQVLHQLIAWLQEGNCLFATDATKPVCVWTDDGRVDMNITRAPSFVVTKDSRQVSKKEPDMRDPLPYDLPDSEEVKDLRAHLATAQASITQLEGIIHTLLESHKNLYLAHFGWLSNPDDDLIRREAQQALAKGTPPGA